MVLTSWLRPAASVGHPSQSRARSRKQRHPRGRPTRPCLEALEDRIVPATFQVLSNLDDGSVGTLRWAIEQANASIGVLDTVQFAIGSGVQTIRPLSQLPAVLDPVILDGTTHE